MGRDKMHTWVDVSLHAVFEMPVICGGRSNGDVLQIVALVKALLICSVCIVLSSSESAWCGMQYLLAVTLLGGALLLAPDTGEEFSNTRSVHVYSYCLSTYANLRFTQISPKWHMVLVAYATWIIYGALFSSAHHTKEENEALFRSEAESFLWLRVAAFVTLCALQTSLHFNLKIFSTKSTAFTRMCTKIVLWAVYAFLLTFPADRGLPQRVHVYEATLRVACFVICFYVHEVWRIVVQHALFVDLLNKHALGSNVCEDLYTLAVNLDAGAKYSRVILPHDLQLPCGRKKNNFDPSLVHKKSTYLLAYSFMSMPLDPSTVSALRAFWIFSLPSNTITAAVTLLVVIVVFRNTLAIVNDVHAFFEVSVEKRKKKDEKRKYATSSSPV
jgi:hypothetical protein